MKGEILKLLKETDGYISGQELCERFGVSRTAVWKVINQYFLRPEPSLCSQRECSKLSLFPGLFPGNEDPAIHDCSFLRLLIFS